MIVVSDASPLHYLILIHQTGLLPALYGEVYAPPIVMEELSRPETPKPVREWISAAPAWLVVQAPLQTPSLPGQASPEIDAGEAQAIALAKELHAGTLLIDDREGVAYALRIGLDVTGTLGVLIAAHHRGLASIVDTLAALQATTFRCSAALYAGVLLKHGPK